MKIMGAFQNEDLSAAEIIIQAGHVKNNCWRIRDHFQHQFEMVSPMTEIRKKIVFYDPHFETGDPWAAVNIVEERSPRIAFGSENVF